MKFKIWKNPSLPSKKNTILLRRAVKILQKIQGVKFAEKFERFEIFLGKDLFHERSKQGYEAFLDNFLKRNKTYEFWGLPCLKLVVVSHSYEWKLFVYLWKYLNFLKVCILKIIKIGKCWAIQTLFKIYGYR